MSHSTAELSGSRRCARTTTLAVLLLIGCGRPSGTDSSAHSEAPAPPTQATGAPWFEDVAGSAGLDFRHENGHRDAYYLPEIMAGGAAWIDLEGDGDLDIYLVQSGSLVADVVSNPPNRLYRNDGAGTFTDVTEASGTGDRHYGMGVVTGDYDNDGDTDLYVTNMGPNTLYRNNGDGTFLDVTSASGTGDENWSTSATFLDYDADGDLDLYVTNYIYWSFEIERECHISIGHRDYCSPKSYDAPALDTLYRNDGDGTFTDVSQEAGIHEDHGNGLGVVCGDFDQDGHADIYVANDGMKNMLWMNQGDGSFLDQALMAGCAVDGDGQAKAGMGVTAVDIDLDGDLDLLVVNLDSESDSFYRNHGTYFVEEAALSGLGSISSGYTRFGVGFIDFDNDGRLDVYEANGKVASIASPIHSGGDPYAEPNLLVRGDPGGKFTEVFPRGGTRGELIHTSRAAAFADFDDDGGMDILVANINAKPYLLRNVVGARGHWIGFSVLETHGSAAIGATVRFEVSNRVYVRDVRTGYSYLAAHDPRIHVGLGDDAMNATKLSIRWSDGIVEEFTEAYPPDQYHVIRRGGGRIAN